MLDSLFLAIFQGLKTKYAHELETIETQFPCEEFTWLEKTLRLRFSDGIQLLKEAGATNSDGTPLSETDDLRWAGCNGKVQSRG